MSNYWDQLVGRNASSKISCCSTAWTLLDPEEGADIGRRETEATAALRRAAAEIDVKAARLHDDELRRSYLASRTPAGVRAA